MTTVAQRQPDAVPAGLEFDLADRMRKSLRFSGISVQEIADYFGVSRNTISAWINGRTRPKVPEQKLWALRTGVPYEWLLPRMDSNHQPSGMQFPQVRGGAGFQLGRAVTGSVRRLSAA